MISATPSAERSRFVLLQTVAADYNLPVFEELRSRLDADFQVYAGAEYFDPTVRAISNGGDLVSPVRNRFLLGRHLLWQTGQWKSLVSANFAVLEFNPRILSTWALLATRRLLARRTILWGHAWPREGPRKPTIWLRQVMARLANGVVVYTEAQAEELRDFMPGVRITAAPNALYSADAMAASTSSATVDIIYVGRLVSSKKPALLLEGFGRALGRLPKDSRLIFVGDGPERQPLESRIRKLRLEDRVELLGHITDFETLRSLYGRSIVSVSAGYVGLSITQSFAFGVPMLIARNEPHAPEIEAAIEGVNSLKFKENDPAALGDTIVRVFEERQRWLGVRDEIARNCAQRYSVEVMAERIIEAIWPNSAARTR